MNMKNRHETSIRSHPGDQPTEVVLENGRWVVRAYNQAGYDCTEVDIFDLLEWIELNKGEWLDWLEKGELPGWTANEP